MRLLLCLALLLTPVLARAQTASVFAAASLTDTLQAIGKLWEGQGHPAPKLVFAASSTLARQIDQGAPANIFASADEQWMDFLAKRNKIVADTRKNLLGNALVLIEPAATMKPVSIGPGFDLLALLGPNGRLATGDPAHVPVGIYARQALTKLGLWDKVQPRLATTEDVRGALLLVARAEAPAGIVYATDAAVSKDVAIAGTFPPDTHDPVTYPFAIVQGGDTSEARALLAFLSGPQAMAVFQRAGFVTK
jgi:molybdate transport system substrate-binding protein